MIQFSITLVSVIWLGVRDLVIREDYRAPVVARMAIHSGNSTLIKLKSGSNDEVHVAFVVSSSLF